jgi:hypothetical protein
VELAVEVVEGRVRQPGLVESAGVDLAVEQFLDRLDVVEHAVVGALGERQDARRGLAATSASSGLAAILLLDVLGANSFLGIGPMMPSGCASASGTPASRRS